LAVVIWANVKVRHDLAKTEALLQDMEELLQDTEELKNESQRLTQKTLQMIDEGTDWTDPVFVEYPVFDPDGTHIVWRVSTFYKSSDGHFTKGEHTIFGELVMKVFGHYDSEDNLKGHWIQVEKDGRWHTVQEEKPEISFVRNDDGKVVGAEVILRDKDGNEVVRRFVGRKLETEKR